MVPKVVASLLALLALAAVVPPPAASQAPAPPNILIVVTDDQWFGDSLSVMPQTVRVFGGGGTEFTNAFATTPLCCPSRASIMTGRYAHNHGVRSNRQVENLDHDSTIQRYLQEAGYQTAIVGKYFNKWPILERPPYFDRWSIFRGGYYHSLFNIDATMRFVRNYSTTFISKQARRVASSFEIEDAAPWFIYVAVPAPHEPFTARPRYEEAEVPDFVPNPAVRERDRSDKPPFILDRIVGRRKVERRRTAQLRTLMSVDDLVAELFAHLDAIAETTDTLAFFLSDNGYMLGEHRIMKKRLPYSGAVRIPLLARWPGRLEAGATDHRLAATIDIAPTILEAAGLEPDPDFPMDGTSLLQASDRERLLLEHWGQESEPTWAATWTPSYEYTEYYKRDDRTVRYREYYDLETDPWQLVNLLGDGDPRNDPNTLLLSQILGLDRACRGDLCP